MQDNQDNQAKSAARPRLGRTRFVGLEPAQRTTGILPTTGDLGSSQANDATGAPAEATQKRATFAAKNSARQQQPGTSNERSVAAQSTAHLMQLSGMMRPLRKPGNTLPLSQSDAEEDCYWPLGIQQVGPLPILNLYGREPFGRTLPTSVPLVIPGSLSQDTEHKQALWKRVVGSPIFKVALALLLGLGLLALAALFVDLPLVLHILGTHLVTPQGIAWGLLAGVTYLSGHVLRGVRWKLFLNPVGKVSTGKTIQLALVAAFLNFLLPMRAGEATKSLALKRLANIPLSKSLPTVAMDRALDLVPPLVIMALVPLLGSAMNPQLWLVFGLGGGLLLCLVLLIGLTVWKRTWAIGLLQKIFGLLPRALSNRIEGLATGCVDGLLAGASRPMIFLPAFLLTCLAMACDGLFIMLAFWSIGFPITFSVALLGYAVYSLFAILPTPPGQLGTTGAIGMLIFAGLLRLPSSEVAAMYLFSHLWTALLITITGLSCLAALHLTVTSAMRVQDDK